MSAFITEPGVPHSIFEIEGAKTCAIEFRSFSKTAGFTGARCGYTVVPQVLWCGKGSACDDMWNRRQTTKFNGASYIIQKGAAAIYTEQGKKEIEANIDYYRAQCQGHHGGAQKVRPRRLRRGQQPLCLVQDSGRHGLLGLLRRCCWSRPM